MKKITLLSLIIVASLSTSCAVLDALIAMQETNSQPAQKEVEAPTHKKIEKTPTRVNKTVTASDADGLVQALGLQGDVAENFRKTIILYNKERKQVQMSDITAEAKSGALATIAQDQHQAIKSLIPSTTFDKYLSLVGDTARSSGAGSLKVGGGE